MASLAIRIPVWNPKAGVAALAGEKSPLLRSALFLQISDVVVSDDSLWPIEGRYVLHIARHPDFV